MSRIKFTIVGDSETGKTCWLSVLKGEEFRKNYQSERLEPFIKKITINNSEYELEFCDTLGDDSNFQERLSIYKTTDVFVICFAENDTVSFKNVLTRWYPEIKSRRSNASIILVCTKCDIKSGNIMPEEILQLKKRCYFSHIGYCSAYSNYNIEEIFKDTVMKLWEVPTKKKPFYHNLFVRCSSKTEE